MKKFFNLSTVLLTQAFVIGLIATLFTSNWVASIWVIVGLFWMLIARGHEIVKDMVAEDYKAQLLEARHLHAQLEEKYQEVSDKYQAKLKENYDLSCENSQLSEVNLRQAKTVDDETLDSKTPDVHHGNIKLKRKSKSSGSTKV